MTGNAEKARVGNGAKKGLERAILGMYKQAIPEQSHPEQSPAHNKRVGDDNAHDHDHKEGHDVTKVYESYEGYGSLQSHKSRQKI